MRVPRRAKYHIEEETADRGRRNLGVYSNDLNLLVYFAEKWAKERGNPYMVIDRDRNLVHHAFAPKPKDKHRTSTR